MNTFICPRCGNKDPRLIGFLNDKPYCRKCISFNGEKPKDYTPKGGKTILNLSYKLTKEQQEISDGVLRNYQNNIDTLISAICGAGKTELVYNVMAYALAIKHRVGLAIPRRDVVIELVERVKEAFPYNKVVAVYGGHNDVLEGDIIVLTTHQLYRYENYFDLLVLDEIDAFPYKNNEVLDAFFKKSVRGHYVLMSATADEKTMKNFKGKGKAILELNVRFHHHPLPVPRIVLASGLNKFRILVKELKRFQKENKPVLVFVPTIDETEKLFDNLKIFCKGGEYVHSKKKNRSDVISLFKRNKYQYLITTAVLERGVTIKNLQVIIYDADDAIYDEYSLIQISGRVGRKYDAPDGEVLFIARNKTISMERAINNIRTKNKFLSDM